MILLLGSEGSMGKRYQAILNYLKVPYETFDILKDDILRLSEKYTSIILATPTPTHYSFLNRIFEYTELSGHFLDILCEKPISTDYRQVVKVCEYALKKKINLNMMEQYKYLLKDVTYSEDHFSRYDYFRTGNDGAWDFYQIIVNHKGPDEQLVLRNKAPIFDCKINNQKIHIEDMDQAYIAFTNTWLNGECSMRYNDTQTLLNDHLKVNQYLKLYH